MKPHKIQAKVRLPEGLHTRVKTSASEKGTTLNAEIVRRIELSFAVEEGEYIMAMINRAVMKIPGYGVNEDK